LAYSASLHDFMSCIFDGIADRIAATERNAGASKLPALNFRRTNAIAGAACRGQQRLAGRIELVS